MHPLLEELWSEISASLDGLSAEHTQLRPPCFSEKWSIQQIMEHLLLTYESSCGVVLVRVKKRTPTKGAPSILKRLSQCAVLQWGYFPNGRVAPKMVTPPTDSKALTGELLAIRAKELLAQFDSLTMEAERLFGRKRSISHGVLGPLSVSQWRRFQLRHGRHHLHQIWAIRSAHGLQA
jgi:hypothetical protein